MRQEMGQLAAGSAGRWLGIFLPLCGIQVCPCVFLKLGLLGAPKHLDHPIVIILFTQQLKLQEYRIDTVPPLWPGFQASGWHFFHSLLVTGMSEDCSDSRDEKPPSPLRSNNFVKEYAVWEWWLYLYLDSTRWKKCQSDELVLATEDLTFKRALKVYWTSSYWLDRSQLTFRKLWLS